MNRFSTGAFEPSHLSGDIQEVFRGAREELSVCGVLRQFLMSRFGAIFESQLFMKLVAYPDRFTYDNALTWNSLLTTVETEEFISMPILRQGVGVLLMASNISKNPDLIREVCPDLPPELVAFFLNNYKTEAIKTDLFVKRNKLEAIPEVIEKVSFSERFEWGGLEENGRLRNWNDVSRDEDLIGHYEYLDEYTSDRD
jgi:hypothetical protein